MEVDFLGTGACTTQPQMKRIRATLSVMDRGEKGFCLFSLKITLAHRSMENE